MKNHTEQSSSSNIATAPNPMTLKPLARSIPTWANRPVAWSLALGAMPALALAQPTGGTVVSGSANISAPDANHTVITQGSNKAIINWQAFSIGKDGYVQFIQPGRNSVILNRVTGSDPSAILGHLSANGQVFLVNPNGVFFGANATVDVAGIVATTLDINNDDFMRGDYRFFRSANTPAGATVINEGSLNANGGYVVLAGDYVANKGVVQAQLGTALLASGEALTLQLAGSSLINYQVDKATVAHLAGVSNTGQILANGGRVIMTADVANDLASTVVNNSGLIQAQSTVEKDGAVYFSGQGGNIANSGTIDASAQAGANGGHVDIRVSGDIDHEAGSMIKVSGADTGTSNAGSVYTWADGSNNYKQGAAIEARGGAQGGDGGQVELSGNKVVNRSIVDLRAPNGKLGTLTLDPNAITIADGAGTDAGDQSTIYEQNLESQLRSGNVALTANGADASITVANLSDGTLDGTNSGSGGSLSMTASGTNSSITFANTANTIKVDGSLTLKADDGSGGYAGTSISTGNLVAGQGTPTGGGLNNTSTWSSSLNLDAGSVSATSLTLGKAISSNTDSIYNLNAHAHNGDLNVNGDVKVDVANSLVGSVKTSTMLQSDSGDVTVTGDVTSNASGQGYHNYNWVTKAQNGDETDGQNATTYYNEQPWEQTGEADHAITTNLTIHANGSVQVGGDTNVQAVDAGTNFQADNTMGGYWQTAGATNRVFWRATAPQATATVNADNGDATFGGAVNVKADGYITQSYGETESWDQMVQQWNTTSASQTVHTDYGCLDSSTPCTGGYGYRDQYTATTNSQQNGLSGNWTWQQSGTNLNGSDVNDYEHSTPWSTGSWDSESGPMSYSSVAGPKAAFNLTAGGNIVMNGLDVHSTNRANSGGSSYTDANWAHQNTTGASASAYVSNSVSGSKEKWWHDDFSTGYSVANSTATANITAGDNGSVALNGGGAQYDVVSQHPAVSAQGNSIAAASMSISTGNGPVTLGGALNVSGASSAEVSLDVENGNGDIVATGAPITVTNAYDGGDGRATFSSNGNIHLDSAVVKGGDSASLSATAAGELQIDNASSATVTGGSSTGTASVALNGTSNISVGDITASSTHYLNSASLYYDNSPGNNSYDPNDVYHHSVDGGVASIDVHSTAGDVHLNGDVKASGYETATIDASAAGSGKTLTTTAGKTITATTSGNTFTSSSHDEYVHVPTYSAGVTLTADSGLTMDSSVGATVTNHNGAATISLTTTGGAGAGISQNDADSVIKAEGESASVAINAGNAAPDSSNAATIALQGDVEARSTNGTATIAINGKSGSVHDFNATSTNNAASVDITTFDADGTLTLNGAGTASGNTNATGAQLDVTSAGSLDSSDATINVANNNGDDTAVAKATLTASGGTNKLGTIIVSSTAGKGTAELEAKATGDLSAAGDLTVTGRHFSFPADDVPQTNGKATVKLTSSSGNVNLANNVTAYGNANAAVSVTATNGAVTQTAGTVLAHIDRGVKAEVALASGGKMTVGGNVSALATDGIATASLTSSAAPADGSDALTVNGNVGASSDAGTANALINTTGGSNASIALGAGSAIGAMGGTASNITILAGTDDIDDMTASNAAAFSLNGELRGGFTGFEVDPYSAGTANLTVAGKSGNVNQFTSRSSGSTANATITAYDGDLNVIGNSSNSAAVSATGNASANLNATGTVTLGDATHGIEVVTSGTANEATLTAAGDAGLNVNGALSATGSNGTATVTLSSASGDISIGKNVTASGDTGATVSATTTIGELNQTAGSILATTNTGTAATTLNSADVMSVAGNVSATVANGTANASLISNASPTEGDALTLNGNLTASSSNGSANASVTTTGDNASIAQGSDSTVKAAGNNSASVTFTGTGATTIDGAVLAAATSDGTVTGVHTGSALVRIKTTGGTTASITQGSDSVITAAGGQARVSIMAGDSDLANNTTQAAAVNLHGALNVLDDLGGSTLDISGASGSVHDFTVSAVDAQATATIIAYNGDLTLDGTGSVTGNYDDSDGASLAVTTAAGKLDSSAATLSVSNTNTGSDAGANVTLAANGGDNIVGDVSAATAGTTSNSIAQVNASATGTLTAAGPVSATADGTEAQAQINLSGTQGIVTNGALSAAAANGAASFDVQSDAGNIALNNNMTALANDANIDVQALDGTLTQAAGTTVRSGATDGTAAVTFNSSGAMTINGNITAASTSDGTVNGTHTESAYIELNTTGGANSSITQGSASTIAGVGRASYVSIVAGDGDPGDHISNTAAFNLNGAIQAIDSIGGARLEIGGSGGSVHNFTVTGGNTPAKAVITAFNGNLTLNGAGTVNSSYNHADGASLRAEASGSLDTSNAVLTVGNDSTGSSAGAQATLLANGGSAKLGAVTVTAKGDGEAALLANAVTTMTVTGNLAANGLGLGADHGSASIILATTGAGNATSTITQNAGTTIAATTTGNAGNATVDIQAGDCCNSAVALNGTVKSIVTGGTGDASVAARGSKVTLKDAKANVISGGSGNALLDVAAPNEIQLKGAIDVQAVDSSKRADIKLISDRLTDGSTRITLSKGNGHVQLASFNTNNVIGVDSASDFDATIQTNYAAATLNKFIGQQAEITFGGTYDRSAWTTDGTPATACLPGMASWASQLQQTADIHVAGNGHLDLVDAKMIFDTTGTTYYHDMKMSPWSVPAGRLAVFVARPNLDRYMDRTDNGVKAMSENVENSFNSNNGHAVAETGGPVQGATPIGGKLFLDGDGVNLARADIGGEAPGASGATGSSSPFGSDSGAGSGSPNASSSPEAGKPADGQANQEEERRNKEAEL